MGGWEVWFDLVWRRILIKVIGFVGGWRRDLDFGGWRMEDGGWRMKDKIKNQLMSGSAGFRSVQFCRCPAE